MMPKPLFTLSKMVSMARCSRFCPWLATLLLFACAPVQEPPSPEAKPAVVKEDKEAPDYSCSYFYFLWGRYSELEGETEAALEAYEKALICDPEAEYIIRKMPVLLLRLDRTEEAVNWLNMYLAERPEDSGARLLLAKIYVRLKRPDDAAEQYRIIHSNDPSEITSRILLAELYLQEQQWPQAEEVLLALLAGDARNYPARLLLARLYGRIGRFDEARQAYLFALDQNWSPDLVLELGEIDLQEGKYADAEVIYREALKKDPASEQLHIALVYSLLQSDKEEEALQELLILKEMSEDPRFIDLTMARLYAKQKKYKESKILLENILKEEEISEARFLLALLALQEKDFPRALAEATRITPDADEYEEAIFLRVRILRDQNKLTAAVRLLEKVVGQELGRTAKMFFLLAALHEQMGHPELSRSVLQRGVAVFPEDGELLYEYGMLFDSSGDSGKAMEIMQRVIGIDPDNVGALNYVGYTWADQSIQLEKALEYILRAGKIKPENGYIRDSLGWVYFRMGRLEEARIALEEALQLTKEDPAVHEHLGDVLLAMGQTQEAAKNYKRALELFEDKAARSRVEKKLESLSKDTK